MSERRGEGGDGNGRHLDVVGRRRAKRKTSRPPSALFSFANATREHVREPKRSSNATAVESEKKRARFGGKRRRELSSSSLFCFYLAVVVRRPSSFDLPKNEKKNPREERRRHSPPHPNPTPWQTTRNTIQCIRARRGFSSSRAEEHAYFDFSKAHL